MRLFGIIAACCVAGFLAVLLILGITWMNYSNREVRLRVAIAAQQKANEASFDAMWKILQQKAGVADQYKNAFRDIFPAIIQGRYQGQDGKGLLAKFITESNPKFSTSLYVSLSNSIEAERKRFLTDQKKLIDLKREHDGILSTFPGSLVLAGRQPVDITVVTSERTEETFKSGKDDNVDLFGKGK